MRSGNCDGDRAGLRRGFGSVEAILKNEHFRAACAEFGCGPPVDFRVRFGSSDILAGENELKPFEQVKMSQGPFGKSPAAAGGDGFRQIAAFDGVENLIQAGQFLDSLRQKGLKDPVRLGLQKPPGIGDIALGSKNVPSFFRCPPHHLEFEFERESLATALQNFIADQIVQVFRIEHQSVHVKDDSFNGGRQVGPLSQMAG